MAEIEKNSIFKTKDASGNILIHYFKTRIENLIGGPLGIDKGGTGQSTAAAARNALGLGNTTGALPIANGGTGAATASAARTALGITPANIAAVPTTRKVNGKALSADVTLAAPDVGARAADWLPTLAQVGGSNENLARNWDWAHPVNQRGVTTQTWDEHNIDSWHTYSAGTNTFTLEVVPGSHLHIAAGSHWLQQGQRYEYLPNGVYTLSVKLLDGTIHSKTVIWDNNNLVGGDVVAGLGLFLANSIGYPYFHIGIGAGYTFDIVAVKLEEGVTSTLAHDVFASYASELVKCQRYYRKVVFKAYCFNVNGSDATLQCSVYYPDMRTEVSTANLLILEIIEHGIGNRTIGTMQYVWSSERGRIMEVALTGSNLQYGHWYTMIATIDCNI